MEYRDSPETIIHARSVSTSGVQMNDLYKAILLIVRWTFYQLVTINVRTAQMHCKPEQIVQATGANTTAFGKCSFLNIHAQYAKKNVH